MKRALIIFLCVLCFAPIISFAQNAQSSPNEPLFKERPFGPVPAATPTPTPKFVPPEPEFQLPLWAWIATGLVATAAVGGLYYGSVRRWHSSNLFDRQYRFPVARGAALRFGAKKCGGHHARIELGSLVRQNAAETKDA